MFKVNNKDTTGVFIVNLEHISHLVLVLLLLTWNMQFLAGYISLLIKFVYRRKRLLRNIEFKSGKNLYEEIFSQWNIYEKCAIA